MSGELLGYTCGPKRFQLEGFAFYGGQRNVDARDCLLKVSLEHSAARAKVLEREYSLLSQAQLRHALRPIELVIGSSPPFSAFEHFGGSPLSVSRGTARWPQRDVLRIARQVCVALTDCHEQGVVHCRLSPNAVLEDAESGDIRLVHFGFARVVNHPSERPFFPGLTPYSAPEQSGRVALEEGHWTDLYALGCILYHLLSGQSPLGPSGSDAFAHRLVAEAPAPLARLLPDVSAGLSDLIERLLAKNPTDRPASAESVRAELEHLDDHQPKVSPRPGLSRPEIQCEAMHGRTDALAHLMQLAKEAQAGATRVVWLSGGAGLGKSRLIAAFKQASRQGSSLFALGKFDQYRRERPYSALLQAIHGLVAHFLSAPEAQVTRRADAFLKVDASLRAIWVQQLPIFKHFIGDHPEPLPLGRVEAANRFANAMSALMDVLCTPEHPLVLGIDDFQWADEASSELLASLIADRRRRHLVLILAFRPQALSAPNRNHALYAEASARRETHHSFLSLEPLSDEDLGSLCAEAVPSCANAALLADLVRHQANGNPFVALEVLRQLEQLKLLTWSSSPVVHGWRLEAEAGARFKLPESTVDFLIERLQGFSSSCQRVLAGAGCIGHVFGEREVAQILGFSAIQVSDALAEARREQWITALDDVSPSSDRTFRFNHDRMQQAAVRLSGSEERIAWYRLLGSSLLRTERRDRDTIFRAADYFTEVPDLQDDERVTVARLFRVAGEFARDDVAYSKSVKFFSRALALLATADSELRDDVFSCQLQLGEALYLNGQFSEAEAALAKSNVLCTNPQQRIKIQKTRFALLLRKQAYEDAITHGVSVLRSLGYRIPSRPGMAGLMANILVLRRALKRHTLQSLRARPDRTTETERDVLDVLILLSTPAYWANERLSILIGLRLLRATLRKGNIPQSPMAYANWCILNQVLFRDPARALEFGRLAEALLDGTSDPLVISRVRFIIPTFVGTLMKNNRGNVDAYERAFFECLRHGEHVFAGHCIDGVIVSLPIGEFTLFEIEEQLARWEPRAARIGSESSLELIAVVRLWCREQAGFPPDRGDEELLGRLNQDAGGELKNAASLSLQRMLRVASAHLRGEHAESLRLAMAVQSDRRFVSSNPLLGAFVSVLVVLSSCRGRRQSLGSRHINKHLKRLRELAAIFPPNFAALCLLAEGEWAWKRGDRIDATRKLKEVVASAVEHGNHFIHALACECLAAHYEESGEQGQHRDFMVAAAYAFNRWGAHTKVRRITEMNPGIGVERERLTRKDHGDDPSAEARWGAILRSIDAVAEVRDTDELALRLLQIISATAGAQRSALVREVNGRWCVIAAIGIEGSGFRAGEEIEHSRSFPSSMLRYALRTQAAVHAQRPAEDERFDDDEYFVLSKPRVAACVPVLHRGQTSLLIYLENRFTAAAFTDDEMTAVNVIGRQAAVSLATSDYHKLQIEALQARINPHFLYNTLSTIAELVIKEPLGAEAALVVLARLYRYMLGSSWDQMVTLKQELEITRDYLSIEKHRFGPRLDAHIEIVGTIDDVLVPALLLQPIAENAVRHGIAKKSLPGRIQIYVVRDQRSCKVRITDDGPGPEPGASADGRGFGLRSVTRRLELLYGKDCRVTTSTERGYAIELQFPVTKED